MLEQGPKERTRQSGTSTDKARPHGLGFCSTWNRGVGSLKSERGSVVIQQIGFVIAQFPQGNGLYQFVRGSSVHRVEAHIQTRHMRDENQFLGKAAWTRVLQFQ